jgi:hypothetical protein
MAYSCRETTVNCCLGTQQKLGNQINFLRLKNHHKLGNLNQQEFVLPQSWSPEVGSQGVSRAVLQQRSQVRKASSGCQQSLVFLDEKLHHFNFFPHVHMAFFPLHGYVSQCLFLRGHKILDLRSTPIQYGFYLP